MNVIRFLLLVCCSFPGAVLQGQAAQEAIGGTLGTIGKKDTVSIRVFREPDLDSAGQLDKDGMISMPLIGSVRLEGLTTIEAERLIERKLRDGYLVRPEVSVRITKRLVKTVTVLGQVRQPGVFTLPPDRKLTLVEVVGMAGGLTDIANGKKVSLKRQGSARAQQVNLREMMLGQRKDIVLETGDVVTVPESWF